MTVETVNFLTDLDITLPTTNDYIVEGDDHIRNIKKGVRATFVSFNGIPVTATEAELNKLASATVSTAEINYLDLTTGPGTAEANKALVTDGSNNIGSINQLSATAVVVTTGTFTNISGPLAGNASTATAFNSARTLSATGDVTGSISTNDGNYTINLQIAANAVGPGEIQNNSVSALKIQNGVVTFATHMDYDGSEGAIVVSPFSTEPIGSAGVYTLSCVPGNISGMFVELYCGATNQWIRIRDGLETNSAIQIINVPGEMRLNNTTASTHTVRYRKTYA